MAVEDPVDTAISLPFPLAPVTELVRPACPADEAEWARAAAGGDKAAFARLVEKHKQSVHGLCFRMLGAGEEARDAAQEAFVRAYTGIRDFDARQPFAAWVLRIARNHCIDLLRRRRPTLALASEGRGDEGPETFVSPELPDHHAKGGEQAMQEPEAQRGPELALYARLTARLSALEDPPVPAGFTAQVLAAVDARALVMQQRRHTLLAAIPAALLAVLAIVGWAFSAAPAVHVDRLVDGLT